MQTNIYISAELPTYPTGGRRDSQSCKSSKSKGKSEDGEGCKECYSKEIQINVLKTDGITSCRFGQAGTCVRLDLRLGVIRGFMIDILVVLLFHVEWCIRLLALIIFYQKSHSITSIA